MDLILIKETIKNKIKSLLQYRLRLCKYKCECDCWSS